MDSNHEDTSEGDDVENLTESEAEYNSDVEDPIVSEADCNSEDSHEMDADDATNQTKDEDNTENHMFEILGSAKCDVKPKVERVLPEWLANPIVISTDLNKTADHDDFKGLDVLLIDILKKNGIHSYFPVQKVVIPRILNTIDSSLYLRPSDVCVSAPTGSGKTLAYVLPVIQALKDRITCSIRALVVLPVKELAKQIHTVFKTYTAGTVLKVGIIGVKNFKEEQKLLFDKSISNIYKSSYDVLICTPHRLVDHICNTPGFSLKDLRYLIIDEADRMMEDMEHNWLQFAERAIFGQLRHDGCLCANENPFDRIGGNVITPCVVGRLSIPCQKLLFSATLSHDPYKLEKLKLFNPKLFTTVGAQDGNARKQTGDFTGRYRTPEELTENIAICDAPIKPLVVWFMLNRFEFKNVLCFTESTESTHRLCIFLLKMGNVKVEEITSNMLPDRRASIFKKFQKSEVDILICTDGMARGIDFENVDYVINYDTPKYPETYIHRIGRTARAGRIGTAITIIASKKELKLFKYLIKKIDKEEIPQLLLPYNEIKELSTKYNEALQEVAICVEERTKKINSKQNLYTFRKMKLSKKKLLEAVRQQRQNKKLAGKK